MSHLACVPASRVCGDWNVEAVVEYLKSIGLESYCASIRENEVDGLILAELIRLGGLDEIGMSSKLHQAKLYARLNELAKATAEAPATRRPLERAGKRRAPSPHPQQRRCKAAKAAPRPPSPPRRAGRGEVEPARAAGDGDGAAQAASRRRLVTLRGSRRSRNTCSAGSRGTGGGNVCEHNLRKDECKHCKAVGTGGRALCEHNRRKKQCKDCKAAGTGGGAICEHNRHKFSCKDCKAAGTGGRGLCEHNRMKYCCKDCQAPRGVPEGGTPVLSAARCAAESQH